MFAAALTCIAQDGHPAAAPAAPGNATPPASSPADARQQGDPPANAQAKESSPLPQSPADSQRHKQISAESTRLLAMASELKAEVDKTNKDTLSIDVIRKADAIERLAKTVREKIKQSAGAS
jgi:nitric oxide reductase activation protein